MTRTLYAWRDSGKFHLSAFREARAADSVRPAREFGTETELLDEAQRRGADVVWENENER